jgi:hypothetical protein
MRKPQWSEIQRGNFGFSRTLDAKNVLVDVRAVDGGYWCPGVSCDVHLHQSYSGKPPKLKPNGLSWGIEVPLSDLLSVHRHENFELTIHFHSGTCTAEGWYAFDNEGVAEFHGREIEGLYEAGLCVPEVQSQPVS